MFSVGESSSGANKDKGKAPIPEEELEKLRAKEGLFLLPWDNSIPENVRIETLEYTSTDEAKRFLQLTLIKNIQSSPLKLEIMERW